jgi:Tfp pilus assembly protein PilO
LSARETVLGLGTLTVVLFGVTYLLGDAKLEEWKNMGKARETIEREIVLSERLRDQRPVREAQLEQGLANLERYPEGEEVAPRLLKAVRDVASVSGLQLTSITPDREENIGQLYELTIRCAWQGELEAIVRFLYTLQSKGVMYDVSSLQVQPVARGSALKGSVYVNCAYLRGEEPPVQETVPAPAGEAAPEPEPAGSTLQVEPVPPNQGTNAPP